MPRSHCKACEDSRVNCEPLVVFTLQYKGWLTACVNSIGIMETARRLEISQEALWGLRHDKRRHIKRSTARKIVSHSTSINNNNQVPKRKPTLHGPNQT
jgi:hypothetical protein